MSTVVAITDRDSWRAGTDVIVVADAGRRRLTWVPRDLWSPSLGDRINRAFPLGGHAALLAALDEAGVPAEASVCLRRGGTEWVLSGVRIEVPVRRKMRFWYPLEPCTRLQDGRRLIVFQPPSETLEGERIHQWIGARRSPDGSAGDFGRIARQQILVRRLLEEGHRFDDLLDRSEWVDLSRENAAQELREVRPTWAFETLDDTQHAVIGGKQVLLLRRSPPWLHALRRHWRRWREGMLRP